jgi:hypothetical protein
MIDVALRRLGYNVVHFAHVPEEAIYPASVFGAECEAVTPPIVARCGAVLRSGLIRIPPGEHLESWRRTKRMCRACEFLVADTPAALSPAAEDHARGQA